MLPNKQRMQIFVKYYPLSFCFCCINPWTPVYIPCRKAWINPHFPHGYPQLSTVLIPILWAFPRLSTVIHRNSFFAQNFIHRYRYVFVKPSSRFDGSWEFRGCFPSYSRQNQGFPPFSGEKSTAQTGLHMYQSSE